jgi:1-deoxy-D-xylulose-5-phosphate synthase
LFDLSYLRHIPNLIVMAPKDEDELQHMIRTGVECSAPVAVRYPRGRGVGVMMSPVPGLLEIGKGEVVIPGSDVLIVAIGSTVYPSLRAAQRMEEMGVHAGVINARFLKPLDADLICERASKAGKVLTVEENVLQGGFGSSVLELFQEEGLHDIQVGRLGIPDLFVEHGPQPLLRKKYGIDEESIFKGAMDMVEGRWSSSLDDAQHPATERPVLLNSQVKG